MTGKQPLRSLIFSMAVRGRFEPQKGRRQAQSELSVKVGEFSMSCKEETMVIASTGICRGEFFTLESQRAFLLKVFDRKVFP